MFIKTFSNNKTQQKTYNTIPTRKQGCFDLPYNPQQNIFTDEYWFHKNNMMPHIQNHRPGIKRRILRVKKQAIINLQNERKRNKSQRAMGNGNKVVYIHHNSYGNNGNIGNNGNNGNNGINCNSTNGIGLSLNTDRYSRVQSQTNYQTNKSKNNKFISSNKQTLVKQITEIPEYAKNIMRPCKIQAMQIANRPISARKVCTANYRPSLNRKTTEKNMMKKTEEDFVYQRGISKIQPWAHQEEDYIVY